MTASEIYPHDLIVVPLSQNMSREGFSCGNSTIDNFFLNNAYKQHCADRIKVHVAVKSQCFSLECSRVDVLGYYTLSMKMVQYGWFPRKIRQLFSKKDSIPVVYLGIIGVDKRFQNNKIGSYLLWDALSKSARIADMMGGCGVLLDADTDKLVPFYQKFGFSILESSDKERTMFIPMNAIRAAQLEVATANTIEIDDNASKSEIQLQPNLA